MAIRALVLLIGCAQVLAGCAQGKTPIDTGRDEAGPGAMDASSPPGVDASTPGGPDAGPDAGSRPDAAAPRDGGAPPPECTAGTTDTETGACGACGEGTHTRTRTCEASGTFGPWSGWSGCATDAQCAPGDSDTDTRACGACGSGTQTRTRSCDAATCRWGSWGSFGTCGGASGCAPGETRACANGDSCGHEVCQSDCSWGGCEPIHECLRIRPGTTGPEGNNYRCCGSDAWQFCLPSCYWSTDCAACGGCGC